MSSELNGTPPPIAVSPSKFVRMLNQQSGCPDAMLVAEGMGDLATGEMDPDERKREYYFLLGEEDFLPAVMDAARELRADFPHGIITRDETGSIVSALSRLAADVAPHIQSGDFTSASYWVHNAFTHSASIATELWHQRIDRGSVAYQRTNELVDENRRKQFGGLALRTRIESAMNTTARNSCGLQMVVDRLFASGQGRHITAEEMIATHADNLRVAMPVTRLHVEMGRALRKVFGAMTLAGGELEAFDPDMMASYFVHDTQLGLQFDGSRMLAALLQHPHEFNTARIGCPGNRYVTEIWGWLGDLSSQYVFPALESKERSEPH